MPGPGQGRAPRQVQAEMRCVLGVMGDQRGPPQGGDIYTRQERKV